MNAPLLDTQRPDRIERVAQAPTFRAEEAAVNQSVLAGRLRRAARWLATPFARASSRRRLRAYVDPDPREQPIRAELFGVERLEHLAADLAERDRVHTPSRRPVPLLERLDDNEKVLRDSRAIIAKAIREERAISPAAEWLVDNFYVIDDQLRDIREHLPPAFYRQLPILDGGAFDGFPRIYALAWAFLEHSDSSVDSESLKRFVQAYQRVRPLSMGELWALPISLRLLLVENMRRLTEQIVRRRAAREAADELADALLGLSGAKESAEAALLALEPGSLAPEFAVQLIQRLRGLDPARTPSVAWLADRVAQQQRTPEDLVTLEHLIQVATHVTVRNVVTSMRLMSTADWTVFFDAVSLVEAELRAGTRVEEMDFPTRDSYRHAVEDLARGSGLGEIEIARRAVERTRAHAATIDPTDVVARERAADPGHALIGAARKSFETDIAYRAPWKLRHGRAYLAAGTQGYFAALYAMTAALVCAPLYWSITSGVPWFSLALVALPAAIVALGFAVTLVNHHVLAVIAPRRLPRLELLLGVPADLRTMVVVPTLLVRPEQVREQVARLEVHYLSNHDGDVRFALLSDDLDADHELGPSDEALFAFALEAVQALNRLHGPTADGGARFLLLHRRRVWSAGEGKWMGWERKRGKLREFNRLLRGATDTTFVPRADAAARVPAGVRYVVTLDADTRLPIGSVRRLVGTLAHPLNRAGFDAATRRVVEGYGVLQPRITATMPERGEGTPFERIFAGAQGLDPYTFAVSDVYQDLLGAGIFTGKGIYEVDAFERAVDGREPENALLSHDLFEGLFARAGLVSDIELFEQYPTHYLVAAARTERWTRGDWQLLPWLRRFIFDRALGLVRNPILAIGHFQILDNARRSLVPPAALAVLAGAWWLPGPMAWTWVPWFLAVWLAPTVLPMLSMPLPSKKGARWSDYLRRTAEGFALGVTQAALGLVFLAHQAWLMSQAIVRTAVRLRTRKHLLQWVSAAQVSSGSRLETRGFVQAMAPAMAIGAVAIAITAWLKPEGIIWALPLAAAWIASPWCARWASTPSVGRAHAAPTAGALAFLRTTARRTWRYFEVTVTPDDHFLPPDNLQEDPRSVLARRTSPTNIGLYLMSVVSARDMGWIGTADMIDRLAATLGTLARLERYRGQFLNWYGTADAQPLAPKYVSTVDSGNLAAALIAVRETCLDTALEALVEQRAIAGISDALALARAHQPRSAGKASQGTATFAELERALAEIEASMSRPRGSWPDDIREIEHQAGALFDVAAVVALEHPGDDVAEFLVWIRAIHGSAISHVRDLGSRDGAGPSRTTTALNEIADQSRALVEGMDFRFLYEPKSKLFSIGFRLEDGRLDVGRYDLLASEARIASLLAIGRGQVPVEHWFRLGRPLVPLWKGSALVSWSGSMFEYLMPNLVLRAPAPSLLEQTARLVVQEQIRYAHERGVPWGISESAFGARDVDLTYQYKAFGVAGLGLKRGLGEDVVVAPYATALAAMIDPAAAVRNLEHLIEHGARGILGFYDAVDYTGARLPSKSSRVVVRTYMAHHQGMTIVAIANVVTGGLLQTRFQNDAWVRAAELLLQERTPHGRAVKRSQADELDTFLHVRDFVLPALRHFTSPHDPTPRTHVLSNGRYAVMVTAAGSGYSHWKKLAVTRWREDSTRDAWGSYVFVEDVDRRLLWSAGYQPSCVEPDAYEVAYYEDRAEIHRRDHGITTSLEVVVSSEDDAEVRSITLHNPGAQARQIELTSYAEVVLAPPAADDAHPAFSKLFVETEFVPRVDALLATRRPRSTDEARIWAAHVMAVEGMTVGDVQYETDRARFLGRGRSLRDARAVREGRALSGTTGPVLDPVFSLRRRVLLPAGGTVRATFTTLVAPTRERAIELADRYRRALSFERTANLAWSQAQVQLRHLGIDAEEAHLFQRLATRILYSDASLRAPQEVLRGNHGGRSTLWAHRISGDHPIVLARVDNSEDIDLVRQLLRAQEYWRMKGVVVDVVIVNEEAYGYVAELQVTLESLVRASTSPAMSNGHVPGSGAFLLRGESLSSADLTVLQSAARIVLRPRHGTLSEQVVRLLRALPLVSPPPPPALRGLTDEVTIARPELEYFNGLGGFADDGREYVVILQEGQWTPAPWINVVARPGFGFQVSEAGSGYTWAENSRENQLSPWSNDPVGDAPGEAFFVRDDETGELWSPTALPIRETSPYVVRHGQGYSRFQHESHDIALDLVQFVPLEDPVKVSTLTLTNLSKRRRILSVTAYVEWVLGVGRANNAPHVVTTFEPESGAILARNPWNEEWAARVAFAALTQRPTGWTADRSDFLGRNGTLERPRALTPGKLLSGRTGAGLDPCAALQTRLELAPGASATVTFLLGQAADANAARAVIARQSALDPEESLRAVRAEWDLVLDDLVVSTPDRSFDLLANRWLLYQTLACRVWARAAFYQAGGAFGFRDQLQDVLALCTARPDLARAQIQLCASRQFREGDVQHWWHEPTGRGVRTRITDDRLWLPYVALHYIAVTGRADILDEHATFLEGPEIAADHHDAYYTPAQSTETASVYEHCARAIDVSLSLGPHGLPLIGGGDWNDGMDRVGRLGRGESVWLGWFLHTLLEDFADVAVAREDYERAARWLQVRTELLVALERDGWDGEWYRRAYFDDGTPLGSASGTECRIDAIAQSWAVLSGAAQPERAAAAMASVDRHLVKRDDGLVLLLTPPFDRTAADPGYIQGYLPGVRENGGQYTHAAAWTVIAFAELGQGDRAGELFALLNPIRLTSTRAGMHRYKVEPYVMAADVYSVPPHVGRGGWTWYTGSAGWMYRAAVEWILGVRVRGDGLHVDPCIPRAWPTFAVRLRRAGTTYQIEVQNPEGVERGVVRIELDGVELARGAPIPLARDGVPHVVRVVLGRI